MEIKVTVELGEKAVDLLGNLLNALNNVPPVKTYAPGGVTVGPDHAKVNTEINESLAETNLFTQEAGEVENTPEPVKEAPAKTRTRRSKAEIEAEKELAAQEAEAESKVTVEDQTEAPKKDVAPDFADMDEDAQLEEIKAYVTRNTKKGKSADVKALLAFMEAGRASELAPDQYETFYDLIVRYTAGEAVDILTGADLD